MRTIGIINPLCIACHRACLYVVNFTDGEIMIDGVNRTREIQDAFEVMYDMGGDDIDPEQFSAPSEASRLVARWRRLVIEAWELYLDAHGEP